MGRIPIHLLVFMCILFLLLSCKPGTRSKEPPVAKNGIMDIKGWDFEKDGALELKGEWKFIWKETAREYGNIDYDDTYWETFYIPDSWDKKTGTAYGYAWFRLTIINNTGKNLGIFIRTSSTEYDLYVNEKALIKNGRTGRSRGSSTPDQLPYVKGLPDTDVYVIAWHISNYHDPFGGPYVSPEIGVKENLQNKLIKTNMENVFMIGIILMMGIYHFLL